MKMPELILNVHELYTTVGVGTAEQKPAAGKIIVNGTIEINGDKYEFEHKVHGLKSDDGCPFVKICDLKRVFE